MADTKPLSPQDEPKVDEIAELRREVREVKEHLAAVEALLLKMTETMRAAMPERGSKKKAS